MLIKLYSQPAEEPDPWNSTFLAHSPGNACVQWKVNTVFLTHWGYEKFDEDCLTVNVYREQVIYILLILINSVIHN